MMKFESIYLFISLFLLIFNGTAFGFIFYQERLGEIFGLILFVGTSLFGALLASIADEDKTTFYSRLFFYGNVTVTLLPIYYLGISALLYSL